MAARVAFSAQTWAVAALAFLRAVRVEGAAAIVYTLSRAMPLARTYLLVPAAMGQLSS